MPFLYVRTYKNGAQGRGPVFAIFTKVGSTKNNKGGPMRQRIKKTLSQRKDCNFFLRRNKLNTKLLHSDKSTYTALRFGPLSGRKVSNLQRPVLFSPEKRGFREKMMSYVGISQAHNAYFYKSFAYSSTVPLVLASLALLFIFGMMMFPVRSIEVFADEGIEAYSGDPAISLSLADTANSGNMTITGDNKSIQEQVDGGNNVGYIAVDFNVKASNVDKYDVYVQSSSSNLVGEATGNTVGSIVSDTTYTDMKNQAGWGYAVAKTSKANPETLIYRPIQTSVNTAADTGSATNTTVDQTYTLAFAANLGGVSADHYKSDITLSVAAGAEEVVDPTAPVSNWSDLVYMQQMSPEACAGGDEIGKQLIDSRDDKVYWVAKLKDGNCWMTQNLDLNLNSGTLTPLDSDVSTNWEPKITSEFWYDEDEAVLGYYDPGDKYCPYGDCSKATSESNNKGHDAQGNYYSFNAAAAGSVSKTAANNSNVSSSICPKGWRLPATNSSDKKSFTELVDGLPNGSVLVAFPYYYVYSGSLYNGEISLDSPSGGCWSSTIYNEGFLSAYSMYFTANKITAAHYLIGTYGGLSVRCVVR